MFSSWGIDKIEVTKEGCEVTFSRHSIYVGGPSETIRGVFTKWVTTRAVEVDVPARTFQEGANE